MRLGLYSNRNRDRGSRGSGSSSGGRRELLLIAPDLFRDLGRHVVFVVLGQDLQSECTVG